MTIESKPVPPVTNVVRGILWMTLAVVFGVFTDAVFKRSSLSFPIIQVIWGRFTLQMLMVMIIFAPQLWSLLKTRRLGLHLVRSVLLVACSALFIAGLRHIPLAEASAILFLAPLVVAAASAPLLGERVGRGRILAIVAGFAGAMIVIRPGLGFLHWAAVFPVGAAVLFAFYQITTRELNRTEDKRTTLLYTGLAGAIGSSLAAPFDWTTPDAFGWLLLTVPAVLGGLHHFSVIRALGCAPASIISPFDYSRLIWAAVLGYLVFGDVPDVWTGIGAAVIVVSGLYVLRDAKTLAPRAPPDSRANCFGTVERLE